MELLLAWEIGNNNDNSDNSDDAMQSGYAQGKSDYQTSTVSTMTHVIQICQILRVPCIKPITQPDGELTGILRPETCKQLVSPQRMKYRNRFNV